MKNFCLHLGIFALFLFVTKANEDCFKSVKLFDKTWVLTKLSGGKISSVAVDLEDNVYFVENNKLFVLKDGKISWPFEHLKQERFVKDVTADVKGNVYFGSNGHIDMKKAGSSIIEDLLSDENVIVKKLSFDFRGNLLVLANVDSYIDQAYHLTKNKLHLLPEAGEVHRVFAVDSKQNIYYVVNSGSLEYYEDFTTRIKFVNQKVNVNSVAVDKDDHLFFAIESGLYVDELGTSGKGVKVLDIPNISKIFFDHKGIIYLASTDKEKGGIYILQK